MFLLRCMFPSLMFSLPSQKSRIVAVCGRVPRAASRLEAAASLLTLLGWGGEALGERAGSAGGGVRGRPRPISNMGGMRCPDGSNATVENWTAGHTPQSFCSTLSPGPVRQNKA